MGLATVLTLTACGILVQSVRSQPPAEPAGPAVTPPADQTYVGTKACTACHFKQSMAWKKTKHATDAFAKLPAKYKTDATCLICHSTGFGTATGFKDEASTPTLAGTTCEACHGPGSKHVETAKPFANKKTLTAGRDSLGPRHDLQGAAAERLHALPRDPGPQGTSQVRQGVARLDRAASTRQAWIEKPGLPGGRIDVSGSFIFFWIGNRSEIPVGAFGAKRWLSMFSDRSQDQRR